MSAPSLQSRHSSVPVERPLSAKSGHSNESSQPLAYRVLSDRRSFLVEADSAILISDPREESVLLKRLLSSLGAATNRLPRRSFPQYNRRITNDKCEVAQHDFLHRAGKWLLFCLQIPR